MEGIEANEREELLAEDLMVPLNGVLCEGEAQHIIDRDLWNTTASNLSDLHCTAEEPADPYTNEISQLEVLLGPSETRDEHGF